MRSPPSRMLNQVRHIAIQTAGLLIYLALAWPYFGFKGEELPWPESTYAIGICAFLIATAARQAWWWRIIHLAFVPLLWKTSQFGIEPGWFLLAFIGLVLIYRGAAADRIPLYLSNAHALAALNQLLDERRGQLCIDLGAGIGSAVAPLAASYPACKFVGVENAPASWLIGYLRTRGLNNCRWLYQSLWDTSLAEADMVYAFLSPEPMTRLWLKAEQEMRPGALFISNSFPVPDKNPSFTIELGEKRQTCLYCYEIASAPEASND